MAAPTYKDVDEKRRALKYWLRDGEWHKRKTIPMPDRLIRWLCSEYPGTFISSQSGYKLLAFATDAEIKIAVADLRSRMEHMRRRIMGMEQAAYNRQFDRTLV